MLLVMAPRQQPDDFDRFWAAYPRRVAKKEARKAWDQLRPSSALVDEMLTALAWQVTQPQWLKDDGAFIPHPASWIRAERWTDEPPRRVVEKWCDHVPECGTQAEHTRRWLAEQRQKARA